MKRKQKTVISERKAGYANGLLHDFNNPLHNENLRKMRLPGSGYYPIIEAYWKGYEQAITERKTGNV